MLKLPTDPMALQARTMAAFCDDLFDLASGKSRTCERTEAIRVIKMRERKEHG